MNKDRRANYEAKINALRERFDAGKASKADHRYSNVQEQAKKLQAACKMFWYLEENK